MVDGSPVTCSSAVGFGQFVTSLMEASDKAGADLESELPDLEEVDKHGNAVNPLTFNALIGRRFRLRNVVDEDANKYCGKRVVGGGKEREVDRSYTAIDAILDSRQPVQRPRTKFKTSQPHAPTLGSGSRPGRIGSPATPLGRCQGSFAMCSPPVFITGVGSCCKALRAAWVWVVHESFDEAVNLIELRLELGEAHELKIELLPNLVKLVLDHREDIRPLHLRSTWTRPPGWTRWPSRSLCACLPAWALRSALTLRFSRHSVQDSLNRDLFRRLFTQQLLKCVRSSWLRPHGAALLSKHTTMCECVRMVPSHSLLKRVDHAAILRLQPPRLI
jgi:hypothetical protein